MLGVQIQRHGHPNASARAKLLGLAVSYKVFPSQSRGTLPFHCVTRTQEVQVALSLLVSLGRT